MGGYKTIGAPLRIARSHWGGMVCRPDNGGGFPPPPPLPNFKCTSGSHRLPCHRPSTSPAPPSPLRRVQIPLFTALCKDDVWEVRRACTESLCDIGQTVSANCRTSSLMDLFHHLAKDTSRLVCIAAYQQLGPLIGICPKSEVWSFGRELYAVTPSDALGGGRYPRPPPPLFRRGNAVGSRYLHRPPLSFPLLLEVICLRVAAIQQLLGGGSDRTSLPKVLPTPSLSSPSSGFTPTPFHGPSL